jgi:hypothetical protein
MPERLEKDGRSLREGRRRARSVGIEMFERLCEREGRWGTFMVATRVVRRRRWYSSKTCMLTAYQFSMQEAFP